MQDACTITYGFKPQVRYHLNHSRVHFFLRTPKQFSFSNPSDHEQLSSLLTMCKYTLHRMKCGHGVFKTIPCPQSIPDEQGNIACPHGGVHPHAESEHVSSNIEGITYGPGVCARIQCRIEYGLLPHNHNGKNWMLYPPDEEPFDMSPEVRAESERRWLAQMSPADRQHVINLGSTAEDFRRNLLAPGLRNAVNVSDMCAYEAIHLTHSFKANGKFPEPYIPEWWVLNPRYMTAFQLYQYTPSFLDVDIANPGAETRGPVAQCPAVVSLLTGQDDMQAVLNYSNLMFWCAEQEIQNSGLKSYNECDVKDREWLDSLLSEPDLANCGGKDHKSVTGDEQVVMYDAEEDRDDYTNGSSETEQEIFEDETDTLSEEGSEDGGSAAVFEEHSNKGFVLDQTLQSEACSGPDTATHYV
ncbi:hypothetical protein BDV97DRAFT_402960 [Delphinella strobiligena]|nr:hypothetical protein BDV97DRAFT_402960 [Delphinella strobiligena]